MATRLEDNVLFLAESLEENVLFLAERIKDGKKFKIHRGDGLNDDFYFFNKGHIENVYGEIVCHAPRQLLICDLELLPLEDQINLKLKRRVY